MTPPQIRLFGNLLAVICLWCVDVSVADDRVPSLDDFLSSGNFASVQISPTGEYLAASIHHDTTGIFQVLNRADYSIKRSFNMGEDRRVGSFYWLDDKSVVMTASYRNEHSNTFHRGRNSQRINIETGQFRPMPRGNVLSLWRDNPDHVLVSGYSTRYTEVDKLNIRSGRRVKVARSASPRASFVFNRDRDIVFSIGESVEDVTKVHQREGHGKWELIQSTPYGEKGWRPFRYGPQDDTYYTYDHRGATTRGIGLYNSKTREHKLLYRHDVVDIGGSMTDYYGNLVAVRLDHHYPQYVYLNPDHLMAQAHASLRRLFPDEFVRITSLTKDSKAMIILVSGDRNPGQFFLVDLQTLKSSFIGERKPKIKKATLATTHGIELVTRDGDTIYGYLTSLPDTPKPGPMVIEIHGGPHGIRDYWGYDMQRQIYATRGYHVLQVNYRGSSGYGIDYRNKGHRQWGRLMQDDITDATNWAIDTEIADPERICIMGGSYGAYSAMMGVSREPDLYKCAVAYAGIYDLSIAPKAGDIRFRRAGMEYMKTAMNIDDPEETKANSPVYHAEDIKASILMVHGGLDRRTPPIHAQRMKSALEKAGNPPEWIFDPSQGHGFYGYRANLRLYQSILRFLEKQIGSQSKS